MPKVVLWQNRERLHRQTDRERERQREKEREGERERGRESLNLCWKVLLNTNSVSVVVCVCVSVCLCVCVCFANPLHSLCWPCWSRLLGDCWQGPVATVPGPADSASHLERQTSAIWSKSYMISANFFHD